MPSPPATESALGSSPISSRTAPRGAGASGGVATTAEAMDEKAHPLRCRAATRNSQPPGQLSCGTSSCTPNGAPPALVSVVVALACTSSACQPERSAAPAVAAQKAHAEQRQKEQSHR